MLFYGNVPGFFLSFFSFIMILCDRMCECERLSISAKKRGRRKKAAPAKRKSICKIIKCADKNASRKKEWNGFVTLLFLCRSKKGIMLPSPHLGIFFSASKSLAKKGIWHRDNDDDIFEQFLQYVDYRLR